MNNKRLPALILAALMLAALLSGCGGETQQLSGGAPAPATPAAGSPEPSAPAETEQPTSEESGEDTGSDSGIELGIHNAKNFSIEYMADGVKLVTDSEGSKLLLTPRGVTPPAGYEDAKQIAIPIEHAMYTSTTFVGYIDALEDVSVYNAVAAVTTAEDRWVNQHILDRFRDGTVRHIAQSHWDVGDIEEVVEVRPEIVFSGGGDESGLRLRGLLDEVNIEYATIMEHTEEGAFAKLEWIKFFAAFYNLDEKADSVYNAKTEQLRELEKMTEDIPAENRPIVAYGLLFNGVVWTRSGTSTMAQEIERAGGIYALSHIEGEGSVTISMEEFFDKCRNVDVLIYGSIMTPDKEFLLGEDPLFAEFDAFVNDRVFVFDQGFYMNSAKVVEQFEDMVYMLHPELMPGHVTSMYVRLPG